MIRCTVVCCLLGVAIATSPEARDLTLNQAVDLALLRSSQASIIRGNRDVAESRYQAERINFYVPEISLNGSLPAYNFDERFEFFGSNNAKRVIEQRNLQFQGFLELRQSLFTGGELTASANLQRRDERYPNLRSQTLSDLTFEDTRRGFLQFDLTQPLFRPSQTKHDLNIQRLNYDMAEIDFLLGQDSLRSEVVAQFVNLLRKQVEADLKADQLRKAQLQAAIDSLKLIDGVASEEDYITSSSSMLDAELAMFEFETELTQQVRELALLLDLPVTEDLTPLEPEVPEPYSDAQREAYLNGWETSLDIQRADLQFQKSRREARFSASGLGLTGDLEARFSIAEGEAETRDEFSSGGGIDSTLVGVSDLGTTGWGVTLRVRYPIFDGGASRAAVRAAEFQAEQARLTFERLRRTTQAEIANLVNQIDVSYRRIDIFQKQIALAENRLGIAETRAADGQISEIEFLDARIFYLEQRDKYFQELSSYLTNRIELESKFPQS